MTRLLAVLLASAAGASAFAPVAVPHFRMHAVTRTAIAPEMGLPKYTFAASLAAAGGAVFIRNFVKGVRDNLEAEKGRKALKSMSTLADLSELKLEQEEGKLMRQERGWREYKKADGTFWYWDSENLKATYEQPEIFKHLDAVRAAAIESAETRQKGFTPK